MIDSHLINDEQITEENVADCLDVLSDNGYVIDVRDRAAIIVMHGNMSLGRFTSVVAAAQAALDHLRGR